MAGGLSGADWLTLWQRGRREAVGLGWGGAEGWGRTENACANWLSPFSSSILSALPIYGMAPDTLREDLP